jgi:hypothetical protein
MANLQVLDACRVSLAQTNRLCAHTAIVEQSNQFADKLGRQMSSVREHLIAYHLD